jgi:hypothetical protein
MKIVGSSSVAHYWFGGLLDRINMLYAAGNGVGVVHGQVAPDFSVLARNDGTVTVWPQTFAGNFTLLAGQAAPDGTTGATKIIADTSNTFHAVFQQTQRRGFAQTFRAAAFLKVGGLTRANLALTDGSSNGVNCTFDLAGGQVGVAIAATGSGWTAGSANITSFGNGWYRCWIDATAPAAATTLQFGIALDNGSGTAAASGTFAGNATDGILAWRCNLLPASAWTALTGTRVFFDDFQSSGSVDLTDSRVEGFNWYLHNAWPDCDEFHLTWPTAPATQPGDLNFGPSTVTLNENRGGFGNVLQTAATAGAGSNDYVGQAWALPALFEASAAWDPSAATNTPGSAPLFFLVPVEFVATESANRFVENDIFEGAFPTGAPGATMHDWNGNQQATANVFDNQFTVVFTDQNVFSCLYVPQASNGGVWGFTQRFFNGIAPVNGDIGHRSGGDSVPAVGLSGAFSPSDNDHFIIILGCSDDWPCTFSSVTVYQ